MSEASPTRTRCLHCGNNPVNHTMSWVAQTLAVVLLPLARLGAVVNHPRLARLSHMITVPFAFFFHTLGALTYSIDVARVGSDRSRVIWEEAVRRGIPMEQCVFFGTPLEQYRARIGGRWHYFGSLPIPPWHDTRAYAWIDDKVVLKRVFSKAGVPVPAGGRATSFARAHQIFEEIQKPVIVKPEVGSRGRHTTTHLSTNDDLKHGVAVAQKLCQYVVIEEHLTGSVYRGTYVNGEVVGILRGDPPRVVGDGMATIAELIARKNVAKHERVRDYIVTDATHAFLRRLGASLDTVLPQGHQIDLTEKVGLSYGGFAAEEPFTHEKTLAYLKKAGDVLGAPVIGFDFIIPDITKDPDLQKWGIIEANSLPFIDLHHFPVEGEPVNVAGKVWDMWLKDTSR